MEFLHKGRPVRNLHAVLPSPDRASDLRIRRADVEETLLALAWAGNAYPPTVLILNIN